MDHNNTLPVIIRRSSRFAMGYINGAIFQSFLSFVLFIRGEFYFGTGVFLCGLGVLTIGLFIRNDRNAQITMEECGITVRGMPPIPWEKIGSARLEFGVRGIEILILEFNDDAQKNLRLQVHGLDMKSGDIRNHILQRITDN